MKQELFTFNNLYNQAEKHELDILNLKKLLRVAINMVFLAIQTWYLLQLSMGKCYKINGICCNRNSMCCKK